MVSRESGWPGVFLGGAYKHLLFLFEKRVRNRMTDFLTSSRDEKRPTSLPLLPERGRPSRRSLLRGSLLGAAAVVPTVLLASCGNTSMATNNANGAGKQTPSATSGTQQTTQLALKSLSESQQAFQEIMNDESQHVTFLQSALKSAARPKPTFKNLSQKDLASFAALSQTLENIGVGAYLMAATCGQRQRDSCGGWLDLDD